MRPFTWLKRVGFSQVSKDCRLTFFSSAPRICTQGLGAAGGVATKDIRFLLLNADCPTFRKCKRANVAPRNRACRDCSSDYGTAMGNRAPRESIQIERSGSVDVQKIN